MSYFEKKGLFQPLLVLFNSLFHIHHTLDTSLFQSQLKSSSNSHPLGIDKSFKI